MACPDKNNDERILNEVARRKASKEMQQYDTIIMEGHLSEIVWTFPEENIKSIVRMENGQWEIVLHRN